MFESNARPADVMPLLSSGRHRSPRQGACFMEFASYLAGERWSDHPACTHPALAFLARMTNDCTSNRARSRLAELIPSVIGLNGDEPQVELVVALRVATAARTGGRYLVVRASVGAPWGPPCWPHAVSNSGRLRPRPTRLPLGTTVCCREQTPNPATGDFANGRIGHPGRCTRNFPGVFAWSRCSASRGAPRRDCRLCRVARIPLSRRWARGFAFS